MFARLLAEAVPRTEDASGAAGGCPQSAVSDVLRASENAFGAAGAVPRAFGDAFDAAGAVFALSKMHSVEQEAV